jgi:O-antigen ligase
MSVFTVPGSSLPSGAVAAPWNAAAPGAVPAPGAADTAARRAPDIAFSLFVMVNAMLFIRPAELIAGLKRLPIYELTIVSCLLFSLPAVLAQLAPSSLSRRPITLGVLAMLGAIVLSHVSHLAPGDALPDATGFAKIIVYYLLLVGIVDTPQRLNRFLVSLVVLILSLTTLSLLQYHGYVNIPALAAFEQMVGEDVFDPVTGKPVVLLRLVSTGIFNDPNDLCIILTLGMMVSLYLATRTQGGVLRKAWLLPVPLFGYALQLTHSRGGFLAMVCAVLTLLWCSLGWKRAVPMAMLLLPVVFVLFSGRSTNLNASSGTGQERIQVWSQGLSLFQSAPLFGIGSGRYADEVGLMAHNSFLHCFTELGFFGGAAFLGMFAYSVTALRQYCRKLPQAGDGDFRRLGAFLFAAVVAYVVGYMSLSRPYVVPTYLVLGLVTAFLRTAGTEAPLALSRILPRIAGLSVAFLSGMYVFIRLMARWS